jgi:hypothetical protein
MRRGYAPIPELCRAGLAKAAQTKLLNDNHYDLDYQVKV